MAKKGKTKSERFLLDDKVLIRPLSSEETDKKSSAGIIIPDTADKDRVDQGIVIALGDGKRNEDGKVLPMRVKKGDRVTFQWGDKVDIDGEDHYIVGESNILIIEK